MRKVLLKNTVHLGEVCHVVKKYVDLDYLLDRCVGLLEDGDDILAALCGLVGDVALDQRAGLVSGNLTGNEDLRPGDNSLGLRCVS